MPIDEQQIGQLIGTVAALSVAFQTMQAAQERNRAEVIDIFKEMRDGVKEVAVSMSAHIKEDSMAHNDVENLKAWRKDAEDRMDILWDDKNTAKGMFSASRLISGAAWSTIAVGLGFLLQWKFR